MGELSVELSRLNHNNKHRTGIEILYLTEAKSIDTRRCAGRNRQVSDRPLFRFAVCPARISKMHRSMIQNMIYGMGGVYEY